LNPSMILRTFAAMGFLACLAGPSYAAVYDCAMLPVKGDSPVAETRAMNNKGHVAGRSTFKNDSYGAALWKKSDRTAVNLAAQFHGELEWSYAHGLNDRGQVVGEVTLACNGKCEGSKPTVWQAGDATVLPMLGGGAGGAARSINNKGRIVGETYLDFFGNTAHATLWRDGQAIDLGTLGSKADQAKTSSGARFINDDNVVVGSSATAPGAQYQNAARWSANGHITDLGALAFGLWSTAWSVNRAGTVVGASAYSGSYHYRAVAWPDNQIVQLASLTPDADSAAYAINESGAIVGGESLGEYYAALIWPSVQEPPQKLQTLVGNACQSGEGEYSLDTAVDINDAGQILVNGYQEGVGWVGFVLTPR
jgi:probable HAF family extracellular repeat protein